MSNSKIWWKNLFGSKTKNELLHEYWKLSCEIWVVRISETLSLLYKKRVDFSELLLNYAVCVIWEKRSCWMLKSDGVLLPIQYTIQQFHLFKITQKSFPQKALRKFIFYCEVFLFIPLHIFQKCHTWFFSRFYTSNQSYTTIHYNQGFLAKKCTNEARQISEVGFFFKKKRYLGTMLF